MAGPRKHPAVRLTAPVIIALVVFALFTAPAAFHPPSASAQGIVCGGTFYASGSVCGNVGSPGVTCSGIYYPSQTTCPDSQGVTCNGIFYPSGTACGDNGGRGVTCNGVYDPNLSACPPGVISQACPNGGLAPYGQPCSAPSTTFSGTTFSITSLYCWNGAFINPSAGQTCPPQPATPPLPAPVWHQCSPGTGATGQPGQQGTAICTTQGAVGGAEACEGGLAYAGARGPDAAALSLACQTTAAGSSAPPNSGSWQQNGATALSVLPGTSASFTIAADGSASITTSSTKCITTGTAIAVYSTSGSGSCITIDGAAFDPSTAPSTLWLALKSAGISQQLYNSLVPWCLRATASAVYLAAIDSTTVIPVVVVDSNNYHNVCGG